MNFQFESFEAFIHMEGHGPFVWVSYAVFVATLVFIVAITRARQSRIKRELRAINARSSQLESSETTSESPPTQEENYDASR